MEVNCELHAPVALIPEKSSRYPLDRRLLGPQSRSGRWGLDKIFAPTGNRAVVVDPSSPLREEHKLQVFGNKMFRKFVL
jgi:hypothetical protein